MFKNRMHRVLAVGAVVTVVAGAAAPVAGAQGKGQTVSDETCSQWAAWFNDDFAHYAADKAAGNAQQAADDYQKMVWDYQTAQNAGCGWAQRVRVPPPVSIGVVAPPVIGFQP